MEKRAVINEETPQPEKVRGKPANIIMLDEQQCIPKTAADKLTEQLEQLKDIDEEHLTRRLIKKLDNPQR